jgi:hypothetical protein
MKKLLLALGMATALGSVAHATPTTTVIGSYTFSYAATAGNAPTITDQLGNPFTEILALNTLTMLINFIEVAPAATSGDYSCSTHYPYNCAGSNIATGTITATFSFTGPSGITGTAIDTATYTANYKNDTDSVIWNSATSPIPVKFTDGATMTISMDNAKDWNLYPQLTFDLTQDPSAVPEPASLALLGAGLLGRWHDSPPSPRRPDSGLRKGWGKGNVSFSESCPIER